MKRIYTQLPKRSEIKSPGISTFNKLILPVWYWLLAHMTPVPGLFIQRYVFLMAARLWLQGRLCSELRNGIFVFPMDSVRYFEFGFMWRSLIGGSLGQYLDVSSPRLLPVLLLNRISDSCAIIANPDRTDLKTTQKFMQFIGFAKRCTFIEQNVAQLKFADESFDTITSISVIEHIPENGDREAVAKIWSLLKPGGRLFLSMPCAAEAMEEYIDYNEYGFLIEDGNGFVFGQRFYDQEMLDERIFKITGRPRRVSIYGEKKFGLLILNRAEKLSKHNYPYWREPYMMGKDFKIFASIDELPGWGVIAMEFCKN